MEWMPWSSEAEWTLIGTVVRPNAIVPFQMDLGAKTVSPSEWLARPLQGSYP